MTSAAWGRWGVDDERGALNRITPDSVLRAVASVSTGEPVSLAIAMNAGGGPHFKGRAPLQHFMTRHGGDYAAGLRERGFGYADDYVLMATHGTTHMDALSHVWRDGLMWNGISANTVTSRGASKCGIENVGPIVTRAVFVDFAHNCGTGERPIHVDELREAVTAAGVVPQPGDSLLIRTGWLQRWRDGTATEDHWSGLAPDCADWIDEQGFVFVGADNIAVEYGPTDDPMDAAPLHVELIRNRGVYFVELLNLEGLAGRERAQFMVTLAPLPLVGGVGSPVHPIAIL
ncbi:cyclase family protein [Rhodococcus sp. WS4]|nr:cyclase family protein [Rhodococcus sp. WS4]